MDEPRRFHVRIVRLDAVAQGLALGVVGGLGVFVATVWLVVKGGTVVGPRLALLAQFFPGYSVSVSGGLIGAGWAFASAFIAGYLVSRVYNAVAHRRGASAR